MKRVLGTLAALGLAWNGTAAARPRKADDPNKVYVRRFYDAIISNSLLKNSLSVWL
jgi:hypothetical protein